MFNTYIYIYIHIYIYTYTYIHIYSIGAPGGGPRGPARGPGGPGDRPGPIYGGFSKVHGLNVLPDPGIC